MSLMVFLADEVAKSYALKPLGLAMMVTSITAVLCLVSFCLYRVMNLPPVDIEDLHAPQNIDTGDTIDAD